jgi:hypothetical protein
MRHFRLSVGLAVLLVLTAAPAAEAAPEDERLRGVKTWTFAIGQGARGKVLRRPSAFDLVVVDGEEGRPRRSASSAATGR